MTRAPSPEQLKIARLLGLESDGVPSEVLAARIHDRVAEAIGDEPSAPSTERQQAFALSMGKDVARETQRVASAWIAMALMERNQQRLAELQLAPGDVVIKTEHFEFNGEKLISEREYTVSSVGANCRVFFKGGNGQGAWPTQLRKQPR